MYENLSCCIKCLIDLVFSEIWEIHDGYNCFRNWGAINLSGRLNIATIDECKARCYENAECTGVMFAKNGGNCHLRKDIQLENCKTNNPTLSLFLRKGKIKVIFSKFF